jgi:TPR repeat protein
MSRIDEIALYHTADQLYAMGLDFLRGTNGRALMPETAEKYFRAAANKGHAQAREMLKKLNAERNGS